MYFQSTAHTATDATVATTVITQLPKTNWW